MARFARPFGGYPEEKAGYDVAQVCIKGHVTNASFQDHPEFNVKHCRDCGSPTVTACPSCATPIRGHLRGVLPSLHWKAPAFCHECGKPHPWTDANSKALADLVDELGTLEPEERQKLKLSIPDLVADTPASGVAVVRFKKAATKVGAALGGALTNLMSNVATEAVKRALGIP